MDRRLASEDAEFWESEGAPVARRNLIWSIFAEHLGFSVWLFWSVSAALLVRVGYDFSVGQLFLLVAIPNLVGSLLRLPYTFAVPKFGGRNWTVISALLLLGPTLLFAVAVQNPQTPYWAFVLISATAGVGGGNFASSMANINFFYPAKRKGLALGLNAAGGNIGVAVLQLGLPVVVGGAGLFGLVAASSGIHLERAGYLYAGLAVLAAVMAFFFMDNLSSARSSARDTAAVLKHKRVGDVVPLHRDLRLVHRLLGRDAAADQAQLLRADPGARRHRHQLRLLRLPGRPGRLDHPPVRRLARRQVRRRARHALHVRRDDRRHPRRAVVPRAAGPEPQGGTRPSPCQRVDVPVVPRRLPVRLRRDRHRQRLDVPDDPGAVAERREDDPRRGRGAWPLRWRGSTKEASAVIGIASAVGAIGGFLIPLSFGAPWIDDPVEAVQTSFAVFTVFYAVCLATTWVVYVRKAGVAKVAGLADARI